MGAVARSTASKAVLGSLNPVALKRGVITEDSLKKRYLGVVRVARRVSNFGQGGFRLFRYVQCLWSSYY